MPTHVFNICGKFDRNRSTKYADIASREIGVNGKRTDGMPDNILPYDVHLRLIGKRVVDFLLLLIEHFSLGITAEALRENID